MISNKLENTFRQARKKWGGNGSGSTPEKTKTLSAALEQLLRDLQIRTMLDYGCGSFTWMAPIITATGVPYVGVDVVPEVIEANINLELPRNARFLHLNQDTVLPIVQLVFVRDVLAHLSNATILSELTRLKKTGAEWLLTSNYASSKNISIQDGGFRPLNLRAIPFNFPEPRRVIEEGAEDKTMTLWRFDEILKDVEAPTTITTFGGNAAWGRMGGETAELLISDGSGTEKVVGTISPDGGSIRVGPLGVAGDTE
jgi:hypothetical protein